jgi:hypothetical protein
MVALTTLAFPQLAQAQRGLNVVAAPITESTPGRQIAVLIAVDKYKEWLPLRYPVSDAIHLKEALQNRYYITDTIELYNEDATKANILKRLDLLTQELKPEDSVFIYYAGHGHLDTATDTAFWVPQDGGTDFYRQENWLPNTQVRGLIKGMKARHVMLVSDSCFSGDILNTTRGSAPIITDDYFKNAYARRSRQVLTSGASESVPDESLFSRALIKTLEENTKPYLDPFMMFGEIRLSQVTTTPLFGTLTGTDHQDGGSFILFLKETPKAIAPVATTVSVLSGLPGRFILPSMLAGTGLEVNGRKVALLPVLGTKQFESSELPPGKYQVQVTGKYPYSETIELKPQSRIELTGWKESALAEAENKKMATEKSLTSKRGKTTAGYITLTVGVVGSAGAVLSYFLSSAAKDAYNSAATTEAVMEARSRFLLMQGVFYGSAVAGGVGFIASPLLLSGQKISNLESTIRQLDEDIRALGSN